MANDIKILNGDGRTFTIADTLTSSPTDVPTSKAVAAYVAANAGGGGGDFTWVVKSADESVTSSATIQEDNDLYFTAEANATYLLHFYLFPSSTGTYPIDGGGCKMAIQLPSIKSGVDSYRTSINPYNATLITASVSPAGDGSSIDCSLPNTRTIVEGSIIVTTGASGGNVVIVWAQYNSHATATKMLAGSAIAYKKLA